MVVGASRDRNDAVCKTDEFRVRCHILGRNHGKELYGPFVVEDLVSPAPYGADALDSCYSIVAYQNAFDHSLAFEPSDELLR